MLGECEEGTQLRVLPRKVVLFYCERLIEFYCFPNLYCIHSAPKSAFPSERVRLKE